MTLFRLLYRSESALFGTDMEKARQISHIVSSSAERNTEVGLTGAIVFTSGVFVQAMEGPLQALEGTFERICCDTRHRQLQLLEFAEAQDRVFTDWSMASVTPTLELRKLFNLLDNTIDNATVCATIQLMRKLLNRTTASGGATRGVGI